MNTQHQGCRVVDLNQTEFSDEVNRSFEREAEYQRQDEELQRWLQRVEAEGMAKLRDRAA